MLDEKLKKLAGEIRRAEVFLLSLRRGFEIEEENLVRDRGSFSVLDIRKIIREVRDMKHEFGLPLNGIEEGIFKMDERKINVGNIQKQEKEIRKIFAYVWEVVSVLCPEIFDEMEEGDHGDIFY